MANLSNADRQRVSNWLMRNWSALFEPVGLSADDVRNSVNATDTWIESNQAAYNSALPAAAQSALTLAQKTLLFCTVAGARVSIAFLKRMVGEVD